MVLELSQHVHVPCSVSMTTAWLYHLVRASPKSQIFRSQDALSSKLLGFRSRCSTFAV